MEIQRAQCLVLSFLLSIMFPLSWGIINSNAVPPAPFFLLYKVHNRNPSRLASDEGARER